MEKRNMAAIPPAIHKSCLIWKAAYQWLCSVDENLVCSVAEYTSKTEMAHSTSTMPSSGQSKSRTLRKRRIRCNSPAKKLFLELCEADLSPTPATKTCRWGPRGGKIRSAVQVS